MPVLEILEALTLREFPSPAECRRNADFAYDRGWDVHRGILGYESDLDYPLTQRIRDSLQPDEAYVILDLGCGAGRFLAETESLDGNIRCYGITNVVFDGGSGLRIIHGDLTSVEAARSSKYILPSIPSDSVDLVTSVAAMMYVADWHYAPLLREVHRILKPEGIAVLDFKGKVSTGSSLPATIDSLRNEGIMILPDEPQRKFTTLIVRK